LATLVDATEKKHENITATPDFTEFTHSGRELGKTPNKPYIYFSTAFSYLTPPGFHPTV